MNPVKPRFDGGGDGWAAMHREALSSWYRMTDLDAVVGFVAFAENTGDRLFMEFVPDDYANSRKRVREFGIVALFDRKASLAFARSNDNALCTATYLSLARKVSAAQPHPARFFWIIGKQTPPWTMVELDITTGEEVGVHVELNAGSWGTIWTKLGLTKLRDLLTNWAVRGAA